MTSLSHWYPRYPGDYQRKTSHLSLVEHGAYAVLLDHYYSTGKPLPAIAEQLHRICRAFADAERVAVQSIIDQFFRLETDGYHNDKADEELLRRGKISEKRRKAAAASHANAPANAEQVHMQMPPHPHPHPQKEESISGVVAKATRTDGYSEVFEAFWQAYPSRGQAANPKKPAWVAWQRAIKKGADPEALIAAAKNAAPFEKRGTEFVPQAVTWLNQERWKDTKKKPVVPRAAPVVPHPEQFERADPQFAREKFDEMKRILRAAQVEKETL